MTMGARHLKVGLRVGDLSEGLELVAEPQELGWARVFFGQDLDGYELMFEQYH